MNAMNKYHQKISQKVTEFSGLSLLKLVFLEKSKLFAVLRASDCYKCGDNMFLMKCWEIGNEGSPELD